MCSASSRVEQLITRYFNQLTRGCQNPQCENPDCASSPKFSHAHITANQAAILAIQLTSRQAPLCYPSDSSATQDGQRAATSTMDELADDAEPEANSVSRTGEAAPRNSSASAANTGSLSSVLTAEESSRSSYMAPNEVTQLLMLLFGVSDNGEATEGPDNQSSAGETGDEQQAQIPALVSSSHTRGVFHENSTPAVSASTRSSSSFTTPFLRSGGISSTSDTLKSIRANSIPSSTLAALVSSLHTAQEKESRSTGLTLHELEESIAIGREQGDWSHLISLLSAVFGSFDALSTSFPAADRELAESGASSKPSASAKKRRATTHLKSTVMDMESVQNNSFTTVNKPSGDTQRISKMESQRDADVCFAPMDQDSDPREALTDASTRLDSSKLAIDDEESQCGDSNSATVVLPVSIPDVRSAWFMVGNLPERQNVVDALMRAVRRLVVSSLHQLLVSQVPDGLDDADASDSVKDTQQRLINMFLILYECPFATDPLHFEHLLLNINRAVTWLPIMLQARLCRAWANTVCLPLANSSHSPPPEQTNLWSLQKILLHHITLRCLTTDHGVPNEDKQICEAALVLRIVYYASLLAGQMDDAELLHREAIENKEFEAVMLAHSVHEPHTSRSRNTVLEDPLGKALLISPHDCRKPFIPAKDFVNDTLNEALKPRRDYVNYRSNDTFGELSFMRLPFLLQTSSKTVLLYYDNRMRMLDEQRGAFLQSLIVNNPELPFLKLHICRERIVEDALLALEITCLERPSDLKKQLLIEFEGEQGVDEGGLSKEFFQLIIEKIFDPIYGMFVCDADLGTYWFNPVPLEDLDREYCLIGTLLGLAIYNDIILDVRFPSVLYRKLSGKLGTYEDLKDARPDLIPGLQALLDYEDDNFEEAFDCTFVISYQDPFGNTLQHELVPNGASIPVTKANRKDFVDRYADFLLNESVKKQFTAFRRGFQMVVDESPLTFLFRPDEIELLVRGSPEYDFKELERVTNYDDYTAESPVIRNFWHVVHNMTSDQQRQLLQFTTGSDRIPVGGMSKMKFTIARQGADAERLPTAHTCFNILLLPDYPTLEQLRRLLLLAITYCKGFGMS
ncbi:hypothetical protein AHF37_00244 [Paragonimus kellicotti]|nr:hypothetical protein AHF37_00244 [Paragonimus kellicotti]